MATRRHSSEYSQNSNLSSSFESKKVQVSDEEKKHARRHLYATCLKDCFAITGIFPAIATGVAPIIVLWLATDMMNAIQVWMQSLFLVQYGADPSTIYNPMPDIERQIKYISIVCAVQAVCQFFITLLWTRVGARVEIKMKYSLFSNMMKSEVSFFDVNPIGKILTLLSEDAESVQLSFGATKATQITSLVQGILGLVMGFVKCWQVAFVSICFIPVICLVLLCIMPGVLRNSKIRFQYISESMTIAEETLSAVRTVKGFNREDIETKRFSAQRKGGARHERRVGILIVFFLVSTLVAIIATMLGDFYYGATFVQKGKILMGDLMTIFMYTMVGSMGIVSVQGTMQGEEKAVAAGARILALAEHVPEIPFDGGETIPDFKGHIEFRNVSFKYPTRDAYVLKNVSFEIKPNQIGALVGHSGSGKSTCVQLLERFYDADEGMILLDGRDIRTLDQHWLHRQIALVSQEPVLFRTTVKENIKYGAHDATDEEVEAAIEIANAKKVIEKLDKGYETMVGDKGSSVSGGQRQRLAIARAVVKNPRILITDEATSALDAQSEKKVQIALDKVMEHCTGVVVAHRLSTIRNADIIYVFDSGEIKESGTHEELVKRGSWYYNLVSRQLAKADQEAREQASESSPPTETSSSPTPAEVVTNINDGKEDPDTQLDGSFHAVERPESDDLSSSATENAHSEAAISDSSSSSSDENAHSEAATSDSSSSSSDENASSDVSDVSTSSSE